MGIEATSNSYRPGNHLAGIAGRWPGRIGTRRPGLPWINACERPRPQIGGQSRLSRRTPMLDVLMITLALAFFAVSVGYAYACDRL
jgi:hypothetical protein